jgi:hypothetical protein
MYTYFHFFLLDHNLLEQNFVEPLQTVLPKMFYITIEELFSVWFISTNIALLLDPGSMHLGLVPSVVFIKSFFLLVHPSFVKGTRQHVLNTLPNLKRFGLSSVLKTQIFSSIWKKALVNYNDGVVVVKPEVVGLGPGFYNVSDENKLTGLEEGA